MIGKGRSSLEWFLPAKGSLFMHRFIALLAIAIFASPALADNSTPPAMEEIKQLVEKLGSQDFQERETATKRLEEIGACC